MTVISVANGLLQMTRDLGLRNHVSMMLTNAHVQSHLVQDWVQPKGPLRELTAALDHYFRNDDQVGRAFLRYAAGQRDSQTRWTLSPTEALEDQIRHIFRSPGPAKALLRIIDAVDQGQPNLISVKAGRFVRSINNRGEMHWEEVKDDFQIAERPVSYSQFLPLAQLIGFPEPPKRMKYVVPRDPILNVPQPCMEDWIRLLGLLTDVPYRLPKEKEWEKGTAKNLRVVDLMAEAEERKVDVQALVKRDWHRRYANAFFPDPSNPLNLGALLINEPERVLQYLRDGLAVSAWDFFSNAHGTERTESVYEHVSIGEKQPDMVRHIGYRYFANRDQLRGEHKSLDEPLHSTFRMAVSSKIPVLAPSQGRRRS